MTGRWLILVAALSVLTPSYGQEDDLSSLKQAIAIREVEKQRTLTEKLRVENLNYRIANFSKYQLRMESDISSNKSKLEKLVRDLEPAVLKDIEKLNTIKVAIENDLENMVAKGTTDDLQNFAVGIKQKKDRYLTICEGLEVNKILKESIALTKQTGDMVTEFSDSLRELKSLSRSSALDFAPFLTKLERLRISVDSFKDLLLNKSSNNPICSFVRDMDSTLTILFVHLDAVKKADPSAALSSIEALNSMTHEITSRIQAADRLKKVRIMLINWDNALELAIRQGFVFGAAGLAKALPASHKMLKDGLYGDFVDEQSQQEISREIGQNEAKLAKRFEEFAGDLEAVNNALYRRARRFSRSLYKQNSVAPVNNELRKDSKAIGFNPDERSFEYKDKVSYQQALDYDSQLTRLEQQID